MTSSRPIAVVTGGATGIGAAIAAHLAEELHYKVIVADKELGGMAVSDHIIPIACDVSKEEEVNRLIHDIDAQEGRLDALICNAGIMKFQPLSALSLAEWNTILATNLTSIFLLAKAGEHLLRKAKGRIITIASTHAHMSDPGSEAYAASKGGIIALTHALAISLGPDVCVNCISPGWINSHNETMRPIDHSQHPAGRVGAVEDIARAVGFLLDGRNNFITGSEWIIDGGMTRKMIYAE